MKDLRWGVGAPVSLSYLSLSLLLFGLVFSFPSELEAQKAKIKITKKNISQFRVIKGKYVCYSPTGSTPQLGKINKKRLKPKRKWKRYNTTALQNRVDKLQNKVDKRKRVKKSVKRKLKRLQRKLSKVLGYVNQCSGNSGGGDGGFDGDDSALDPYNDQLTATEVDYLLNKVALGGSYELREIGLTEGLEALVDALVDGVMSPQERSQLHTDSIYWASLNYYYPDDPPGYGRIWTSYSVQLGQMHRLLYSRDPFHEWMLLMLAAHFATNINAVDFSFSHFYHYGLPLHWKLLRDNAVGNFQTLSNAMFLDPVMNFWLDNKDNRLGEPNQNYAREFLELFNLGAVDPKTGLANYDEESIVATTAYVSGYSVDEEYEEEPIGEGGVDPETGNRVISIYYSEENHDPGSYTLFRGIPGAEYTGNLQPEEVLDHVLYSHPGAARYIAERFAGQMLYPGLSENIVASLASTLRANNYDLKPFLKRVLRSQAMFSGSARASCVSSPLEHFVRLTRKLLDGPLPRDVPVDGEACQSSCWFMHSVINAAASSGQHLFEPPSVFGWKNSCNINRSGNVAVGEEWITAQRLLNRGRGCIELLNQFNGGGLDFVDVLGLENGMNAIEIVNQIASYVWNYTPTAEQLTVLSRWLTELRDDEGNVYPHDPDLSEEWYVRSKMPRLVCLLGDLVNNNLR